MKIRCIVVDDEPVALEKMQHYVEKTPYLELVAACDSPIEAMRVLSEESVDAIFTDINMLGLNGLDFVESLSRCPLVVFVTAYTEYAADSYKVGAVDYIVKPYGYKEFQRASERLRTQYELLQQSSAHRREDTLFVRTDCKWVRIKTDTIRYIQGLSDYLRLVLEDNSKPLVTYATFAQMKKCLPDHFLQVHRSWIVNTRQIQEIERARIIMDKETYIPIGDSYKEELVNYLLRRSVGRSGRSGKNVD